VSVPFALEKEDNLDIQKSYEFALFMDPFPHGIEEIENAT
jgi:hypothetical protein